VGFEGDAQRAAIAFSLHESGVRGDECHRIARQIVMIAVRVAYPPRDRC